MTAPPTPPPWLSSQRDDWLAAARGWVRTCLGGQALRTTVLKRRPWSFVMKIHSSKGTFYFKACADPGRHEAVLVPRLAEAFPDLVPGPLAQDPERAWLLLPDCGARLPKRNNDLSEHAAWHSVLPAYAALQVWASTRLDEWGQMQIPNRRPERLPARLQDLLADPAAILLGQPDGLRETERQDMFAALPDLEAACRSLAAGPIPASLDHGDLHSGNLLLQDGRFWLVDWGDANLAHPFCSLMVTLHFLGEDFEGPKGWRRIASLREASLAPWTPFAARETLETLFRTALWVAHICRALNIQHMLSNADDGFRQKFQPELVQWLRRWFDNRERFL